MWSVSFHTMIADNLVAAPCTSVWYEAVFALDGTQQSLTQSLLIRCQEALSAHSRPAPRTSGPSRRMSMEAVEQLVKEVEVEGGAIPRASQDLSRASVSSRQCQEELIEAAQEELRARYAARKQAKDKAPRQEAIDFAQRVLSEQDGFRKFTEYMNRMFNQYSLVRPTVTVQIKDLTVTTQALVGSAGLPTVGNVLPQAFKDAFLGGGETAELNIIKNVNAVLEPGKLVLLLGPPGSGKSTLLKALTGRLKPSSNLQVSGSVLYNGKTMDTFTVERTAAYVDQHDLHIPVLTVGETLDFAWSCSGGQPDFLSRKELQLQRSKSMAASRGNLEDLGKTGPIAEEEHGVQYDDHTMDVNGFVHDPSEQGWNQDEFNASMSRLHGTKFKVEMVLRLLGLSHARDTIIGNTMMRGVSGGERKRVTSGEMMVGNTRVMAMDEISTGLDSATLYTIITYLKQAAAGFKTTMVISLLQPPPEVMHLFDDVMLLSEGTLVYTGPVKGVQPHFEAQGFVLPPRMDLPSWLGEITTPTGQWKYASKELKQRWYTVPDNAELYSLCRQRTKELSSPKLGSKAQHSPRSFFGKACGSTNSASSAAGGKAAELVPLPAGKGGATTAAAGGSEVVIKAGSVTDVSSTSGRSSQEEEVAAGEELQPCVDPLTGKPPFLRSVDQLAEDFWQQTDMGRQILEQVNSEFDLTSSGAMHPRALVKERYALNFFKALGLALNRQWLLYRRTTALLIFRFIQMTVMGIIIGTLFYDTQANVDGVRIILGASFVTALFLAFGSAPELGLVLMNRGVWYKHRDNLFMQTSAELLSMVVVRAFNTAIECIYFGCIVYFMVGYVREAGAFFTYLLLMFSVSLSMSALFRLVGAIAATPTHAQAYAATTILVLIITSGFAIIRTAIPPWWIWAYYISPIAYALRGIAINELTSYRWSAPTRPGGPTIGEAGLESLAFFTERKWIWIGVGYLIGFTVVVNLLAFFALKYYSGAKPRASVPDEEALLEARLKAEAAKQKQEERLKDRTAAQGKAGSKTAAAAAPEAVAVELVGASESNRMPFTPITLVFKDLRYYVPNPSYKGKRAAKKAAPPAAPKGQGDVEAPAGAAAAPKGIEFEPELELLKGITGYAQPTVLMALMGGSGAGKTTLMDVIAGRKTVGRISGDILVNGQPKDQKQWARVCGYVEQNDIHTPATTVKEALQFSARLRLPASVTDDQVATHVYDVMSMVDLTDQQYDLVGVPGQSGLSTEQRKRLTIAVELVANPAVVFLDEPTSGLDARAAAIVMKAIKNVASGGRTVFVTIHQPSINIFESFDSLLLMQRGGRTTYFGPLGEHSSTLVSYLESVPGTTPLPSGHNPATWMLEVTGGSMATLVGANKDVDWPSVYQSSALAAANAEKVEELSQQPAAGALAAGSSKAVVCANCRGQGMYAQGFWPQLRLLLGKTTKAYWRSPAYNFIRLMITTFCALVYGTMYYNRGALPIPATVGDVQNILGVLYSACSFLGNVNAMTGMPYFSSDRVVFYREQAALMYDPLALGIATMLCEVPYVLAQVSIFVPIVYWMVGFEPTASKFFFYFLVVFINLLMYTSFGMFLVMSTPMFEIAQLLNTALNFIFNVFNGFTIAYNQIPGGWRWMNRIVPVTWVIYALSASQLGSVTVPMTGYGVTEGTPVYQYLQDVFGYHYDFKWYALLIAASYVVFFTLASIWYMRHVNFLRR